MVRLYRGMDIATGGLSYLVGLLGGFCHSLAWCLCLGVGEKEHISLQDCFLVSRFADLSMVGLVHMGSRWRHVLVLGFLWCAA